MGLVRDYTEPQLKRLGTSDLVLYMSTYLYYVYLEGRRRGYGLNASKISILSTINRAKTKLITIGKKMEVRRHN